MQYITIICIVFGLISAVSKIAFEKIRKDDEKKGLFLNSRTYTIRGTVFGLFQKGDRRLKREEAVTYNDFVKKDMKTSLLIRNTAYTCAAAFLVFYIAGSLLKSNTAAAMLLPSALSLVYAKFKTIAFQGAILFYTFALFITGMQTGNLVFIIGIIPAVGLLTVLIISFFRYHKKKTAG